MWSNTYWRIKKVYGKNEQGYWRLKADKLYASERGDTVTFISLARNCREVCQNLVVANVIFAANQSFSYNCDNKTGLDLLSRKNLSSQTCLPSVNREMKSSRSWCSLIDTKQWNRFKCVWFNNRHYLLKTQYIDIIM